ncbi:hypothetical protein ACQ4PT_024532 [Festuca glaucescens]
MAQISTSSGKRVPEMISSRCSPESTATLSLELTNYLQFKGLNVADYVSSPVFRVGGYDWEIRFYPQGINEDCRGNASVLVWCLGLAEEQVSAKFTLTLLENKSQAQVVNMEPAIFKMMLHYIYTDSLPECQEDGGYGAEAMQDLLTAASSYKLDRLKIICQDELCKKIDQETVTTLSALADQHGCNRLKVACDKFVPSPK